MDISTNAIDLLYLTNTNTFKNLNYKSIGIELQNKGHNINYERFTKLSLP